MDANLLAIFGAALVMGLLVLALGGGFPKRFRK